MMKRAALLIVLVAGSAAAGCSREVRHDGPPGGELPDARAALVSAVGAAIGLDAGLSTLLFSEHDADVSGLVGGRVRAVRAELGDAVRAGDILAVLEDDREAAQLASATATLELARAQHDRAVELRQADLATEADLEIARYRLHAAEAALREAQVALEHTRIRAPFAGAISHRAVRFGQTVRAGDVLFRVTALRPLRAQVRVPERDAVGLRRGQALSLRGLSGEEIGATIARVAPAVDPVSGTIELLVDVPDPGALRPGSAVTVVLTRAASQ
jgi:membrane fusion protein, multidrug efflux system